MSRSGRRTVRAGQQGRELGLEVLESRVMLTAAVGAVTGLVATGTGGGAVLQAQATTAVTYNLVPSFAGAPTFTGSLVTGLVITGTLKVNVTNKGTGTSPAGLQVRAYLRPAAGGADISLLAAGTNVTTVKALATGMMMPVTLNLTAPATVAAGTYSVVVVVDPTHTNNSVVLPGHVTLSAGYVSLSAALAGSTLPTSIVAGTATKAGNVSISLTNLGNIPTTLVPAVNLRVVLHPTSGGTDISVFSQNNVKLPTLLAAAAGKANGKDTLTITVPAVPGTKTALVPSGQYTVMVTVTPVSSKLNLPTLLVKGPSIKVTGGTTTTGGSVLKHGDTVTFTADTQMTGSNFLELGNFVTNTGATGSYRFSPAGLSLTYDSGGTDADTFAFTGGQVFLDPVLNGVGQKVVFSFSSTGAILSFPNVGGKTAYAKYG